MLHGGFPPFKRLVCVCVYARVCRCWCECIFPTFFSVLHGTYELTSTQIYIFKKFILFNNLYSKLNQRWHFPCSIHAYLITLIWLEWFGLCAPFIKQWYLLAMQSFLTMHGKPWTFYILRLTSLAHWSS